MFKRKTQPAPLPETVKTQVGRQLQSGYYPQLDYFTGRNTEPVYDVSGCAVQVDAVMVRLYRTEPYRLCIRIGTDWHEVATFPLSDPILDALPIQHAPDDPRRVQKEQEKAERERQQREAAEAYQKEREEYHLELKRRREERQRRAAEENRRRLG